MASGLKSQTDCAQEVPNKIAFTFWHFGTVLTRSDKLFFLSSFYLIKICYKNVDQMFMTSLFL